MWVEEIAQNPNMIWSSWYFVMNFSLLGALVKFIRYTKGAMSYTKYLI